MRTICAFLLLATVASIPAHADSDDLSGGVMFVHAPPALVYTGSVDWCDSTKIASCEDQVTRVDAGEAIWFVLSAWQGVKSFSAVEFGFGDYDSENYIFEDWGLCVSDAMALYHPSEDDWPGPNTGIALAASGGSWSDSLAPICWFAGYAYAGGDTISLIPNAATGNAGWVSGISSTPYETTCLGALGIGADGIACCPDSARDGEGEDPPEEEGSPGSPDADWASSRYGFVPRVVLAKVAKGALEVPSGSREMTLAEAASREDVLLADPLADALESEGVFTLARCIPHFDPRIRDRNGDVIRGPDDRVLTVPNDLSLWFRLTLNHDDVLGAVKRLRTARGVMTAQPNMKGRLNSAPNDPLFSPEQWNLDNYGQYCDALPGMDVNALAAWDVFGWELQSPVRVGILDIGIVTDHEDLPNVEAGYDFIEGDYDPTPDNGHTHGTKCAGIIGMEPDNDKGGAGLAYGATIVSYRQSR